MKKNISLILALTMLCLCLFGCANINKPDENELPTDKNGQEESYFSLKALPDIGEYSSGDIVKYYFDDGAHREFEPSGDYGKIVPYIKSTKLFESPEYFTYTDPVTGKEITQKAEYIERQLICEYGFATADGRIITEPFFNDFFFQKGENGKDYYLLINASDEGSYYAVAADGSWILEFEDYPEAVRDTYLNKSKALVINLYDENKLRVYNLDGEMVFETVNSSEQEYFCEAFYWNEEYYVLSKFNNSEKVLCTCFDKNGKKLRTFDMGDGAIKGCIDGIFPIENSDSCTVKLIDTKGNTVKTLSDVFECTIDHVNSCLLIYDYEEIRRVGTAGENLGSFNADISSLNDYCESESEALFINTDSSKAFSSVDGKEIQFDLNGKKLKKLSGFYSEEDELLVYAIDSEGYAHIFEPNGNKLADLDSPIFREYEYVNISVFKNVAAYVTTDGTIIVRDLKTGKETKTDGGKYTDGLSFTLVGSDYLMTSDYMDDHLSVKVYSAKTGKPAFDNIANLTALDSYYVLGTTDYSLLFDNSGKTIIKIMNGNMF